MNGDDESIAKTEKADWEKLLSLMREFLEGQNARDVCVRYFAGENAVADVMLIAGSTSRRAAQGLADGIGRILREAGRRRPQIEGYDLADWILVDGGDVIVHIFQENIREMYRLEDLWNTRPEGECHQ